MNQPAYEKKCECQPYDDDQRSTLIKMELPEYEDGQYRTLSRSILSTMRFVFYLLVLVLLGYSLWRIHEIENAINASDRYVNITRLLESNNLNHHRRARSVDVKNFFDPNGLGVDGKGLPRGSMLTAKNEEPVPQAKKPMNKDEFVQLMNTLFDKIQYMHNDTDRSHFDNNMKAVFRAWLPVFDTLLPRDMMENQEAGRVRRSADKSSEESSEEKKPKTTRSVKDSSEESDEKKGKPDKKSSEESSEEKKTRTTRSAEQSSEESSEKSDHSKQESSAEKNSEEAEAEKDIDRETKTASEVSKEVDVSREKNEELSEEEHERRNRSVDSDSSESSESFEKKIAKSIHKNYIDEYSRMKTRQYLPSKKKYSKESLESSESLESRYKKLKKINDNNKFIYVVTDTQVS